MLLDAAGRQADDEVSATGEVVVIAYARAAVPVLKGAPAVDAVGVPGEGLRGGVACNRAGRSGWVDDEVALGRFPVRRRVARAEGYLAGRRPPHPSPVVILAAAGREGLHSTHPTHERSRRHVRDTATGPRPCQAAAR